jgi:glutamate synthase domain-containing protein 2
MTRLGIILLSALTIIVIVFVYDLFINKKHTILRNFPVIGHFRYWLEKIGPELRQYLVAQNREEFPFNRTERSYVYASAKKQNNMQGFGSDADFRKPGHFFFKQSTFPFRVKKGHPNFDKPDYIPCAKVVGPNRKKPYHPQSVINISAMSYGALGKNATQANNMGAGLAGAYHNTGEGGFSEYHNSGSDVVFQIGTAYYGCRDKYSSFSMGELIKLTQDHPNIKMIEVKISQGAKPGKGGVLPAEKVTPEIAKVRGIEPYTASISPGYHTAFSTTEELVTFIEWIAEKTGLPVGIKSAVGNLDFWHELSYEMSSSGRGPDFITIDGGEGGTGAAPASFADNVSLPFEVAFTSVYSIFKHFKLENKIVFIGSAKLGLPSNAAKAFAMGVDMINLAREILMSVGCIQAQKCHTGNCPAGIATHKWWLQKGLDVDSKKHRVENYIKALRKDILEITHALGYEHPSEIKMSDVVVNHKDEFASKTLNEVYEYEKDTRWFYEKKRN